MIFTRTFTVDKKYLAFPVTPMYKQTHNFLSLYEGEELLYEVFLDIDLESPGFYAFCDIERFHGREITACAEGDNLDERILPYLLPSATYPGEENLYREPGRSHLHFSPARGYASDPNGLFYYDGVYHMFYQHDPFNLGFVDWKDHVNFGWGHAVSTDLIHWKELPDALLPDERGPIFSGTGLVDLKNESGLQRGEHPPIILYYTAAGGQARRSRHLQHEQCIAISEDGGKTFTKYKNNPIVPFRSPGNRDPKVFFHPVLKQWMMVVYTDVGEKYLVYTSRDLLHFDYICDLKWDNMECPDLLYLNIEEEPNQKAMVLWGANGSYVVVDFDGQQFYPLAAPRKLQSAFLYTCAQTFNNAPDGRCIQMAVYRMESGRVANGCMTIPHDLRLHEEKNGEYWLEAVPTENLRILRTYTQEWSDVDTPDSVELPSSALADIEMCLPLQDTTFTTHGILWKMDQAKRTLTLNGETIPLAYSDRLELRVILDSCCAQIYEPNNRIFAEFGYEAQQSTVRFLSGVKAERIRIHHLKSIWER